MKERLRIDKHPWQRIAKPFAFKAWRKRHSDTNSKIDAEWRLRHPEHMQLVGKITQ